MKPQRTALPKTVEVKIGLDQNPITFHNIPLEEKKLYENAEKEMQLAINKLRNNSPVQVSGIEQDDTHTLSTPSNESIYIKVGIDFAIKSLEMKELLDKEPIQKALTECNEKLQLFIQEEVENPLWQTFLSQKLSKSLHFLDKQKEKN